MRCPKEVQVSLRGKIYLNREEQFSAEGPKDTGFSMYYNILATQAVHHRGVNKILNSADKGKT